MKTIWITLPTIRIVEDFVSVCTDIDADLEVASGEHTANGKSLLGLMTLNLSKPLELRIRTTQNKLPEILEVLRPYCI